MKSLKILALTFATLAGTSTFASEDLSVLPFDTSNNALTSALSNNGPLVNSTATIFAKLSPDRYFAPLVLIQQPGGKVALLFCGTPNYSVIPETPAGIAQFIEKQHCLEVSKVPVPEGYKFTEQLSYQPKSRRYVWLVNQSYAKSDESVSATFTAVFDPASPGTLPLTWALLNLPDGENLQSRTDRQTWAERVSGVIQYPELQQSATGYVNH